MRTATHTSSVELVGKVTSVNSNSSCCVFLGVAPEDDTRSLRVVQFRRSEDRALADRAAELSIDAVVSLTVDPCSVGTTRLVGRALAVVK